MDRIVVVTKPTRLEELVRQHLTLGAARFALESQGQPFLPYEKEDAIYKAALAAVLSKIPNDIPVTMLRRDDIPNFLFRDNDVVLACGPDGLFVNLAKYVQDQLVITVNPDPRSIQGVLMLFSPSEVGQVIKAIINEEHRVEELPFIKASIDDTHIVWGINDVFVGRKDHISARYQIAFDGNREQQSSSGVIISTGVGSTGWLKSVSAMIQGITGYTPDILRLPADEASEELVFVVREPFPSPITGASIVTGRITPDDPLQITSEMPDGGYIFSDGIVEKALRFNAGSKVVVTVGERYVNRVQR